MSFAEKNWKEKIKYFLRILREFSRSHLYGKIPNSPVTLTELFKMETSYKSMFTSMGFITKALKNEFNTNETILDVPSGTGFHSSVFIDNGLNYVGMDISEKACAVAQLKFPRLVFINFSIYDVKSIFQQSIFDNTYCCALLEHIGNWQLCLENLIYLAKKKVVIVFYEGLSDVLSKNYYEFHPFTDDELINYSKRDVFGLKPVIAPQKSNCTAFVFQQSGNFRISITEAMKITGLCQIEIKKTKFNFDVFDNTVSMRHVIKYAQDHNSNFSRDITNLKPCLGQRFINPNEIGYFMNRFSYSEMSEWLSNKKWKFKIQNFSKKKEGEFASSLIIEKN